MEITREALQARRAELEQGARSLSQRMEQLKADLQATAGGILDCEYWLEQLDAPAAGTLNE